MKEKEGYLIYLDLLGYKNIIKGNKPKDIEDLRAFISSFSLRFISGKARLVYGNSYDSKKLLYKCYSDNFLIFYEADKTEDNSLVIAAFLASHLLGVAIQSGFLLRGSIVFGKLEFNERVVFGKSIVEAYELESNHVDPSVVLSNELQAMYTDKGYFEGNLLSPFSTYACDDYESAKAFVAGIERLIERLNYQSIVDERTLEKYRWLIKEFNRYYDGYCHLDFVEGPSHYSLSYEDSSENI